MTGNGPTYPFAGIPSFLRSKICADVDSLDADIAIMGAPTDLSLLGITRTLTVRAPMLHTPFIGIQPNIMGRVWRKRLSGEHFALNYRPSHTY